MANINLKIDHIEVSVPEGTTILAAAKTAGIRIPTLCAYEGMGPHASCRLCIVSVAGEEKEKLACAVKAADGMDVITDSEELFEKRKAALTEMFRQHTVDCHHCARVGGSRIEDLDPKICENCFYCDCQREGFCELQALAREFGISQLPFEPHGNDFEKDESTGTILRDPNKCIKCRRCVDVCKNNQLVGVLGMVKTPNGQTVGVTGGSALAESGCIRCGRCVDVCPTGAVYLKEYKDELPYYAHRQGVKTAVLMDESVLPELSGLYGGSISMEQLASALRKIGVDRVYAAEELRRSVAADVERKVNEWGGAFPVIAAVDPAAKKYLEKNPPENGGNVICADTAQKRFAEVTKGQFDKVFRISGRNSLADEVQGTSCADYFYNARELFRILKRTGADPLRLPGSELDSLGIREEDSPWNAALGCAQWQIGGEPKLIEVGEGENTVLTAVCGNPFQLKKAMETAKVVLLNA